MVEGKHKEEYIAIVAGLGVLALIFFLMRGNQGGSSTGYSVIAPSAAETSAALSADATSNAAADSLAATQSNNATQAFDTYVTQNDGLNAALASIQAGVKVAKINATSQTQIASAADSAQVQVAGLQTAAATQAATVSANAVENVAASAASATTATAQYGAQAASSVAASQAQAAKNANPGNSTGGILAGIGSIFSSALSFLNLGSFGANSPSSNSAPVSTGGAIMTLPGVPVAGPPAGMSFG